MSSTMYERLGFLNRTALLWSEEALEHLAECTVTIAGCGGVGGAAATMLARMGVGGFVLADPGLFDEPDINRQWTAFHSTLNQNKAAVQAEMLKDINPNIRVQIFEEGVTADNVGSVVQPANAVVDCLDIVVPLELRLEVYRLAYKNGAYCISAPILGPGTLVLAAKPGGMPLDGVITNIIEEAARDSKMPAGFDKHFFPGSIHAINRHIQNGKAPSVALAPSIGGAIAAAEIVFGLLRKFYPEWREPVALPDVYAVDLMLAHHKTLDFRELFPDAKDDRSAYGKKQD